MQAWQERVMQEKKELDEKWGRLIAFIASPDFERLDKPEQNRMRRQENIMAQYSEVLSERIENFV